MPVIVLNGHLITDKGMEGSPELLCWHMDFKLLGALKPLLAEDVPISPEHRAPVSVCGNLQALQFGHS